MMSLRQKTKAKTKEAVPRAGASAPAGRYTVSSGTVFDTKTGRTWQQASSATYYTWANAGPYCASLNLNGTGWRLPSVKELQTLVDDTVPQFGPTIDLTIFPNTPGARFWASTLRASDSSYAWEVDFTYGTVDVLSVAYSDYVRCVR